MTTLSLIILAVVVGFILLGRRRGVTSMFAAAKNKISMPTFFCRLLPPRPTFAVDMTAEEAALMASHAEYWKGGIAKGQVHAFGFVAEAAGPFGIGVVEFESPDGARAFTGGDPVIRAGAGFAYEISLMPLGVTLR